MTAPGWTPHIAAGLDPAVDLTAAGSLPASWVGHWMRRPDAAVLHHPDDGWTTAAELQDRTRDVAGRYAAAGMAKGDQLLLSAAPSTDLVVAYVAALRLGLVVVPINTAYLAEEIHHVVEDGTAVVAVVDDPERAGWIREAGETVGRTITTTPPSVDLPAGRVDSLDDAGLDDPALLVYTSGTTGRPKGALLSHGNLLASAAAVGMAWRWTPEDRLTLTLPLFHLHGLGVGLHGTFTAGAAVMLRPGFDPADVLVGPAERGASMFFGVPTMYARLADHAGLPGLGGHRLCVSGSAPLAADLWRAIADGGDQQVLERYGMTETVMAISNPYEGERRPGSVGLPLPLVETRIDDAAGLHLRGPNVFSGYWRRPEENAVAFDDAGWFDTGDLVEQDPDGYVRIVGRRKELIITGGYNVSPREIEEALEAHPGVTEAAVVGIPSQEWGEAVTAYVVGPETIDAADLTDWMRERVAPYKRPKSYRSVDTLPRNALGKLQRHLLGTD